MWHTESAKKTWRDDITQRYRDRFQVIPFGTKGHECTRCYLSPLCTVLSHQKTYVVDQLTTLCTTTYYYYSILLLHPSPFTTSFSRSLFENNCSQVHHATRRLSKSAALRGFRVRTALVVSRISCIFLCRDSSSRVFSDIVTVKHLILTFYRGDIN